MKVFKESNSEFNKELQNQCLQMSLLLKDLTIEQEVEKEEESSLFSPIYIEKDNQETLDTGESNREIPFLEVVEGLRFHKIQSRKESFQTNFLMTQDLNQNLIKSRIKNYFNWDCERDEIFLIRKTLSLDKQILTISPNNQSKNSHSKLIEKKISKKQKQNCNCKKSKCLKLYCECFQKGRMCGEHCDCQDCFNNKNFLSIRTQAIDDLIEMNPLAFKPKLKTIEERNLILHSRGCNCNKSNCVQKYCECFANGVGCTLLCQCLNCQNTKKILNEEEKEKFHEKNKRKKRKKSFNDLSVELYSQSQQGRKRIDSNKF